MPTSSLLDRWFAAVRAGEAADFTSITTDDVVLFWNGDTAVIPWAGEHRGPDGISAFYKLLRHHIEYQHAALLDVSEADWGAVITLAGRWRVRDTETIVEARAVNILRYRDGKVAGFEVYSDTGKFAAGLATAPT